MAVPDIAGADYVVVGGGTAGSVLAARLSQNPDVTVVLLEAGGATAPETSPQQWPSLIGTEVDWAFTSVPQPGLEGSVVPYPRGKVLGGSSSINAMAHIRGHRLNYDQWVAEGAPGWGYEDLLPYLRKSEKAPGRDPGYRGTDGPMELTPPVMHPFAEMARDAVAELGFPLTDDLSGAHQEGAGLIDHNIVGGARQSAADAYLRPAMNDRPNLNVITGAQASRLLMRGSRCEGVEFRTDDGTTAQVRSGEVIVCGGVFGSPQLLLLSGIGPAADLRSHGIDVIADLPAVGGHLQDHPVTTAVFAASRPIPRMPSTGTLFAALRTEPRLPAPEIQLMFVDYPFFPVTGTDIPGGFSIAWQALRPQSRGRVTLASPDPRVPLLIDPGFYSDETDMKAMLRGLRLARELSEAKAFAGLRAGELAPGPDVVTAEQQRAFLRSTTHSAAHPVGTCRIGTGGSSVVDPALRVHGIEGLRVADAAVMPSVIGANTNATVLAIAEKAADLITTGQVGTST
jgi:choline dehydrogenase